MIKVFGVGDRKLCDDGVGVKIVENIKNELELNNNIEVIIGETDFRHCLDYIKNDDFVIIVDGTYFDLKPGYISKLAFEECDNLIGENIDSNSDSLLKVLRREYREIKGYLIGIEINKIDNSLDLSPKLDKEFNSICNRVLDKIRNLLRGSQHRITC